MNSGLNGTCKYLTCARKQTANLPSLPHKFNHTQFQPVKQLAFSGRTDVLCCSRIDCYNFSFGCFVAFIFQHLGFRNAPSPGWMRSCIFPCTTCTIEAAFNFTYEQLEPLTVMLFNASNARNARKLNQRSRRRYPDGGSVT